MRASWKTVLPAAALAGLALAQAQAQDAGEANAILMNPEGERIGNVALTRMEQGVRVFAEAEGIEPGVHGFHVHETGRCEPPDFQSAGGHFNPDGKGHGWDSANGPHAGDLPNVHVQDDGFLEVQFFTDQFTLEEGSELFDEDGSAVVLHAGADDYQTDPAGDSGSRIACGVIEPAG